MNIAALHNLQVLHVVHVVVVAPRGEKGCLW